MVGKENLASFFLKVLIFGFSLKSFYLQSSLMELIERVAEAVSQALSFQKLIIIVLWF